MPARYILALDQGTTSSRAILFDRSGKIAASAQREVTQHYPQPAWVEHDANEIWSGQWAVVEQVLAEAKAAASDVAAIGITNQRETVVLWDRETSQPIHRAIVWQCRRTADRCDRIRQDGFDKVLQEKTGLVADAYFSSTKIAWLLENVPGARDLAARGRLACGTIDSWLLWNLTRGRVHATDTSNASRTQLLNLRSLAWDDEILRYFSIPRSLLPELKPSSGVLGETDLLGGQAIPVAGVAGDQQASLFGHRCFLPGAAKNTYGTGCFLLMNTGEHAPLSPSGLLSTVAWQRKGATMYALEGSIFIAGAAVQWLRDELGVIATAGESEEAAGAVPDTGGVYFVPALTGLGAPYWNPHARGAILGLTRGSNRNHVIRAALESMAYQTRDVMDCMVQHSGLRPDALRVDGGAARNDFLLQFQADILGLPVERAPLAECTALGAAMLAGLAVGFWKESEVVRSDFAAQVSPAHGMRQRFEPSMETARREELVAGWRRAVARVLFQGE
jgi:glycerol kinase